WVQFNRDYSSYGQPKIINEETFAGLTPNTTYNFYARTNNSDSSYVSDWIGPQSQVSRIEKVENLSYDLKVTSAGVKTTDILTNLSSGESGLFYELRDSAGSVLSSTWTKSTDYIYFESLNPNTTYYFKSNSRNAEGLYNSTGTFGNVWTKVHVPSAPVVGGVVTTAVTVNLDGADSNPDYTEYSLEISSDNFVSDTRYAGSDYSITASPWWDDKLSWENAPVGRDIGGLSPATEYSFRWRGKNLEGIDSVPSIDVSTVTLAVPPVIETVEGQSESSILISWTDTGQDYTIEYSTFQDLGPTYNWQDLEVWTTATSTTSAELVPNSQYWYRVKTRNSAGVPTDYSEVVSGWTDAYPPVAEVVSGVGETSVTANWGSNGNPSGTQYQVRISSKNDFSVVTATEGFTADLLSHEWTGLSANTLYYMQARSLSDGGGAGNFVDLPSTYTHIEAAEGIEVQAREDSYLTVKATGSLTNLGEADSRILFEEVRNSTSAEVGADNWTLAGLLANATYQYRATAYNSAGIPSTATAFYTYATQVEEPTGAGFENISTGTLQVQALPLGGFNNITEGESAVAIKNNIDNSTSGWKNSDGGNFWWTDDGAGAGLTPNTSYTYSVRVRNREGAAREWMLEVSTWTLANEPSTPTVSNLSIAESGHTRLKMEINKADSTPDYTEFLVEITTGTGAGADKYYVQDSSGIGAGQNWASYEDFGGFDGQEIKGLTANTTYYVRTRSRNGAGIMTSSTAYVARATRIEDTGVPVLGEVSSSTVKVKHSDIAGLTNLEMGDSGWKVRESAVSMEESPYYQTDSYHTYTGLTPNTTYTFEVRTKNLAGVENPYGESLSTMTAAAVPGAAGLSNASTGTIKITISDTNSNPLTRTEYVIGISTYDAVSPTYFVQADSTTAVPPAVWQTYGDWGGALGIKVQGLNANTTYYVSLKARNDAGRQTSYSLVNGLATDIEEVNSTEVVSKSTHTVQIGVTDTITNISEGESGIRYEAL
ncbi:MAG: fibronectin type III domain-containing protein, partial [Elusimicrobia bacterium]|nr:fibronectin type III domain-containing protein [Elusimicrobiota bacterium]